jgi:hypothetical protein
MLEVAPPRRYRLASVGATAAHLAAKLNCGSSFML